MQHIIHCHKNAICMFRSACRYQRRVRCLLWSGLRPFFPYIVRKQCRLQACLDMELSFCGTGLIGLVTKMVFACSEEPVELSDLLGVFVGRVYVHFFFYTLCGNNADCRLV